MDEAAIEKFAIRCAKGNNGGEWSTHYTEDQKEFWRAFVRDIEAGIIRSAALDELGALDGELLD